MLYFYPETSRLRNNVSADPAVKKELALYKSVFAPNAFDHPRNQQELFLSSKRELPSRRAKRNRANALRIMPIDVHVLLTINWRNHQLERFLYRQLPAQ